MTGGGAGVDPSAVTFRDAGPADLDAVLVLARRYCEADGHLFDPDHRGPAFAGLIDHPERGRLLLALRSSEVAGYAVVTWGWSIESGGAEALLDEIYVDPQGHGIGSALLDQVVAASRAHGARRLFMETERANHRARALYLRRGFLADDSIWLSQDL